MLCQAVADNIFFTYIPNKISGLNIFVKELACAGPNLENLARICY